MTLVIALIANAIHTHLVGEPAIDTIWIVAIWVLHLFTIASRS
jgi:hypothetical protein